MTAGAGTASDGRGATALHGRGSRPPARVLAILFAVLLLVAGCTGGARGRKHERHRTPGSPGLTPSIATPITPHSVSAFRYSGWLHTDGIDIVDGRGRPVRLVGIGIHGMELGAGNPAGAQGSGAGCGDGWKPPSQTAYSNITSWGFNTVRLAISWANLEPTPPTGGQHHWNMPYVAAIDQIVRSFGQRGIGVILDMHQNQWTPAFQRVRRGVTGGCVGNGMPTWLYQGTGISSVKDAKRAFFTDENGVWQGFIDAWRFIAGRYGTDSTVVGADMLNEPYSPRDMTPQDLHLGQLYAQVGAAIRSVAPHVLLIFEDSQDLGTGQFALSSPPPFPNVVYSFHLYRREWSPDGQQVFDDYVSRARSWRVPVWIGEFNGFGGGSNTKGITDWQGSTAEMLRVAKQDDVSWSFWAYSGSSSLVQPGTDNPKSDLVKVLQTGF